MNVTVSYNWLSRNLIAQSTPKLKDKTQMIYLYAYIGLHGYGSLNFWDKCEIHQRLSISYKMFKFLRCQWQGLISGIQTEIVKHSGKRIRGAVDHLFCIQVCITYITCEIYSHKHRLYHIQPCVPQGCQMTWMLHSMWPLWPYFYLPFV